MSERRPQPAPARLAGSVERWLLPRVEGMPAATPRPERRAEMSAREAARHAEESGYAQGMARAQAQFDARLAEIDSRLQRLDAVLQQAAEPLRTLDDQLAGELLRLALAVGRQLARRELRTDPAQVIAILRECLEQLPLGARQVRAHLHPEDAAVVRERLVAGSGERAWTLVDDATLGRGECLIHSEHSQIDARFDNRLHALVASALGDERSAQREAATPPAAAPETPP